MVPKPENPNDQMEGASEHPKKSAENSTHPTRNQHTAVWYMQGAKAKAKPLDYYPTVEEIFQELAQQSNTKLSIPAKAKEVNLTIEEPLTNQEKEEDYELRLHISTFMSEETPAEDTNKLQLTIVPPMTQKGSTPTKQQVTKLAEKSISPVHQQEGGEGLEEDIESDNPKYVITKDKIKKLVREVSSARKNETRAKGKGKHKLILSELEYEE